MQGDTSICTPPWTYGAHTTCKTSLFYHFLHQVHQIPTEGPISLACLTLNFEVENLNGVAVNLWQNKDYDLQVTNLQFTLYNN